MIRYDPGRWSIGFAFGLKGSVFPKALLLALPCSLASMVLHTVIANTSDATVTRYIGAGEVGTTVLSGFSFILGFLLVFRSQQAYSRWWEGGTLLQQLRGEWFNAFSSLLAFCDSNPTKAAAVEKFQHQLARLVSLMYANALQRVGAVSDNSFEVIDLYGTDPNSINFMQESHDACEVVLQWVQRLVVEAEDAKTLKIAPPILSRVFNQLGNGIVNLNNAQKITDFPIPFPLSQMITIMLLVHLVTTAVVCASSVTTIAWCGMICFIIIMSFWSINFIAVELEMPFGDDENDLPLYEMQKDLNCSLIGLLRDKLATRPPDFTFDHAVHSKLHCTTLDFNQRLDEQFKEPFSLTDIAPSMSVRRRTSIKVETQKPRLPKPGTHEQTELALEDIVLFAASTPTKPERSCEAVPDTTSGTQSNSPTKKSETTVPPDIVGKSIETSSHGPPGATVQAQAPDVIRENAGSSSGHHALTLQRQMEEHLSVAVRELQCLSDGQQQTFNLHCDLYGLLCASLEKLPPLSRSLACSIQGAPVPAKEAELPLLGAPASAKDPESPAMCTASPIIDENTNTESS